MKILVFAGTTEGTTFVVQALLHSHTVTASVATEYGAALLREQCEKERRIDMNMLTIVTGRRTKEQIAELAVGFEALVDATHPYALEVTQNLLSASASSNVPYYRLRRKTPPVPKNAYSRLHEFTSLDSLIASLAERDEKSAIFISTGSKDLQRFACLKNYRERLFVRVLPSAESLLLCEKAGILPSHIIAMQGAFSKDLNTALFREYGCTALVTKESGESGGFAEKLSAASALDMDVYALLPPPEPVPAQRVFYDANELLLAIDDSYFLAALMEVLQVCE